MGFMGVNDVFIEIRGLSQITGEIQLKLGNCLYEKQLPEVVWCKRNKFIELFAPA